MQLHSIFSVLPSSQTSRQILHTASSSGISSSVSSAVTGVISSANETHTRKNIHRSENFCFYRPKKSILSIDKASYESNYSSYQHPTLINHSHESNTKNKRKVSNIPLPLPLASLETCCLLLLSKETARTMTLFLPGIDKDLETDAPSLCSKNKLQHFNLDIQKNQNFFCTL